MPLLQVTHISVLLGEVSGPLRVPVLVVGQGAHGTIVLFNPLNQLIDEQVFPGGWRCQAFKNAPGGSVGSLRNSKKLTV